MLFWKGKPLPASLQMMLDGHESIATLHQLLPQLSPRKSKPNSLNHLHSFVSTALPHDYQVSASHTALNVVVDGKDYSSDAMSHGR